MESGDSLPANGRMFVRFAHEHNCLSKVLGCKAAQQLNTLSERRQASHLRQLPTNTRFRCLSSDADVREDKRQDRHTPRVANGILLARYTNNLEMVRV